LRILLLGRTKPNRARGGIARSAKMIRQALASVGDEVILREVTELLTDIPQGVDVVWHYGDWKWVDQQVAAAVQAGVPIVVNSTYDDHPDRRKWMAERLDEWDPSNSGLVYMGVFTHEAELDVRMSKMAPRIVAIPKTIRCEDVSLPFEKREGICLGEVEKLGRVRLVDGMDVQLAVDRLRRELPGVPLSVYNQYGTRSTKNPVGTKKTPYQDKGFLEWISRHRLYVSLMRHETFAMVPAEAQSVGTPVLYRYMPQSLGPHLGFTGYRFDTIDELVLGAIVLYSNKRVWEQFRDAGRLNALARGQQHVGGALDLALRKVVLRASGLPAEAPAD
jgi:hypothetical protein